LLCSAWASVLTAINSTPLIPSSLMRFTALVPDPTVPDSGSLSNQVPDLRVAPSQVPFYATIRLTKGTEEEARRRIYDRQRTANPDAQISPPLTSITLPDGTVLPPPMPLARSHRCLTIILRP
jgi:hypothetical protein